MSKREWKHRNLKYHIVYTDSRYIEASFAYYEDARSFQLSYKPKLYQILDASTDEIMSQEQLEAYDEKHQRYFKNRRILQVVSS